MGMDISDRLMLGVHYDEISDWLESRMEEDECSNHYEVVEMYFDIASPYYDAGIEECFIGYRLKNEVYVNDEWFKEINALITKFVELTGITPRLYGGANVY